MPQRRLLILLHENDPYPRHESGFVWLLNQHWERARIETRVVKGVAKWVDADLVFPHIDLTWIPDEYLAFLDKYPRVINRRVHDISKRAISKNLVNPGDAVEGPVIVKTNLNCGGLPEQWLDQHAPGVRATVSRFFRRITNRWWNRSLETAIFVEPQQYAIFPSLGAVPAGVFSNPNLIVERFLPEREGNRFALRTYLFLGDFHVSVRLLSDNPIVKAAGGVTREAAELPPEIEAARHRMGFDYGKLDFVLRDGIPVLLDANRTPGHPGAIAKFFPPNHFLHFSRGIESLFERESF